jgi:heterodisulfide reductase subunit A
LSAGYWDQLNHKGLATRKTKLFGEVVLVKKGALVIGGGVAGIQAALDLADSDYQVYLVERSSTLGGRMAQIDKTFPSMDCAI